MLLNDLQALITAIPELRSQFTLLEPSILSVIKLFARNTTSGHAESMLGMSIRIQRRLEERFTFCLIVVAHDHLLQLAFFDLSSVLIMDGT